MMVVQLAPLSRPGNCGGAHGRQIRSKIFALTSEMRNELHRLAGLDRGSERTFIKIIKFAANRQAMG
jgi:hypothetical protein